MQEQKSVRVGLVESLGCQEPCLLVRSLRVVVAGGWVEGLVGKTMSGRKSTKHDRSWRRAMNCSQAIALLCSIVDGLVHVQAGVLGVHFGQHGPAYRVGTLHAAQLVMRVAGHHNQGHWHRSCTQECLPSGSKHFQSRQSQCQARLFITGTSKLFESRKLVHQGQRRVFSPMPSYEEGVHEEDLVEAS